MPAVIQNATKFWAEDLDQYEARYLHGRKICSLPPSEGDERVPSQGTVLLDSPVNIDEVVGRPSISLRLGAAFLTARRTMANLMK